MRITRTTLPTRAPGTAGTTGTAGAARTAGSARPPASRRSRRARRLALAAAAALAATALVLTGCTAEASPDTSAPPVIEHVHGIAPDPRGDDLLLATHNGIFAVAESGDVSGPLGGYDFDAMGFTVAGDVPFASGTPGPETPAELGAGNLGIIRSDDGGETWVPMAFTGVEDFHVLTAGPDGTLYGVGSSGPELRISTDGGENWQTSTATGAVDLAVTDEGILAATEAGLQRSTDGGKTFAPVAEAPVLYSVAAREDGALVGAGVDGAIWSSAADGTWTRVGSAQGAVQALNTVGAERIVLVDDRGVVELTGDDARVLSPRMG